jgi:[acyl-carrier-protein] S-malonyltransferase
MTLGIVFPGQGSQSIGMLGSLAETCTEVRDTFAEASDALGYDLWALCQEGPEERLNATEQTQPAMLAAGVAVWRAWCARGGPTPALSAGHSLGEYSALVAAGALDFAAAAAVVRARGRYMQEAVPAGQGAIAAVLGLDDEAVVACCEAVCAKRPGELVCPVNYNAPGQVVVAGHAGAVEEALAALREAGARRAVPLPMSVPVHCELMRPAAQRLVEELRAAGVGVPAFPVLHNADLATHDDPEAILQALATQLYTPVRWSRTVTLLRDRGVSLVVECGPGRVLAGLSRRIDRDLACMPVHDPASLDAALKAAGES